MRERLKLPSAPASNSGASAAMVFSGSSDAAAVGEESY